MRVQVPGRNEGGTIRRSGVPQFRQLHVMLMRGIKEFESIIPGFKAALVTAGAQSLHLLKESVVASIRTPAFLAIHWSSHGTLHHCNISPYALTSQ